MSVHTHELDERGFVMIPGVVDGRQCEAIGAQLGDVAGRAPGSRNALALQACQDLAAHLMDSRPLAALLPMSAVAVQCTLFDKTNESNWLVALHQDLSIPVRERIPDESCTGWSEKEGQLFVQPPVAVLDDLVAFRVHLDACVSESGPLRVVPGSHRHGRLSAAAANDIRSRNGEIECLVPKGGVLAMRPLLLHASSRATAPMHRRVLHFVFGPAMLPHGLQWPRAVGR